MRRAYDYWQDQPGCYHLHLASITPDTCAPSETPTRHKPTGRRSHRNGAGDARSVFSIGHCIAGVASSPTSRSDRCFSSCLLATFPRSASTEALAILTTEVAREREFTALALTQGGTGSVQDRIFGAWRAAQTLINTDRIHTPFSRWFGALYDT